MALEADSSRHCTPMLFRAAVAPQPKIKHLRQINQAVERARQHATLTLVYPSIPVKELALVMNSDSSLANIKRIATQGAYIVAATSQDLAANRTAPWAPMVWRSGRLHRVVSSTLAGEAQAHLQGGREVE